MKFYATALTLLLGPFTAHAMHPASRILNQADLEDFENRNMLTHGVPLKYQVVSSEHRVQVHNKWFDLDAAVALDTSRTHCDHDGQEADCDESGVLRGQNEDGDIFVIHTDGDGNIDRVLFLFEDGSEVELVNVGLDPNQGLFVEFTMADMDPQKLSQLLDGLAGDADKHAATRKKHHKAHHHHTHNHHRLLQQAKDYLSAMGPNPDSPKMRRNLQNAPCSQHDVLEVAIGYDTSFCSSLGSASQADSKVRAIVEATSALYERPGMCIKLDLTEIDGYCAANSDPYRDMIRMENSGCDGNTFGSIQAFSNYWNNNKGSVKRDTAHLFSGTGFECDNNGSCTIGCAEIEAWCSNRSYGVNCKCVLCNWPFMISCHSDPSGKPSVISTSDSMLLQTLLFAHELGHNGGAEHDDSQRDAYIMYPSNDGTGTGWSPRTITSIRNHVGDISCLDKVNVGGGGPSPTPAPGSTCSNNELEVKVSITTDQYPEETSWIITKGSSTVRSSPTYSTKNKDYSETFCLTKDSYQFKMRDTYGDGQESPGKYQVQVDGQTVASGNALDFGTEKVHNFGTSTPATPSPVPSPTNPPVAPTPPPVAPTPPPVTPTPPPVTPTPPPVPSPTNPPVTPTPPPVSSNSCNNNQIQVQILITTDEYPEETSWTIRKGSSVIKSSPTYSEKNKPSVTTHCLAKDAYTFQILDTYGDGLLSPGKYEIKVDGESVITGSSFEFQKNHNFGSTSGPSPTPSPNSNNNNSCSNNEMTVSVTIRTDQYPEETSWTIRSGSTTVESSPSYSEANKVYVTEGCLATGTYVFEIEDSYGDGLIDPGMYKVSVDGSEKVSGSGDFGFSKSYNL